MDYVSVERRTLPIAFSKAFESLLLNYPSSHQSLSHDLELAIERGLELFSELSSVSELEHTQDIRVLVALTNRHITTESKHFKTWYISLREDLIDEVDQIILTHGDDLNRLGLDSTTGNTAVFLAIAGTIK